MYKITKMVLLPIAAVALLAADPSWMTKPVSDWDQRDARQLLAGSPWVKYVIPAPLPAQSEAERRAGGQMGGGRGVGLDAFTTSNLIGFGARPRADDDQDPNDGPRPVAIRWESSLPVRSAEERAGQNQPGWSGDFYVIAVYGVQSLPDARQFENELKRTAFLKVDSRKMVQPVRVDIVKLGKGTSRILYLFPRSQRITAGNHEVEFMAEMGQFYVAQFFDPREMQFQGKLAL